MCLAALYWSRCDAIFYGNSAADAAAVGFDDSFLYEEVRRPLDQRRIPIVQMLPDQALVSFNEWAAREGRIEY
jgi:tRNA(Arg) A34 adenosine deaminase TadA